MKHLQPDGQFYAADAITPASGPSIFRVVYENGGKRLLDLVLAIALVPVLAPVILGLAALVWAKDGGKPFFEWTLGPNNLFWHFLETAAARGYRYMMQLEADPLPLRPRWLDKLVCIAVHGRYWVVGSPFLAQCALPQAPLLIL